ncbi:MAG: SH3 domain-containing protein [Christensenellaceae bacterium]|jgi:hypothetical protein|nr:SH3 domain-containing protein [Christensenellaceae bacterium]
MKRIFALSIVLALVLVLCLGTASASSSSRYGYGSGYTAFVDASSLNLRAAPSTGAARIGSLHRGAWVNVLEDLGSWSYVECYVHGYLTRGYVYTGYLFVGSEYVQPSARYSSAATTKTVKKVVTVQETVVVVPSENCWPSSYYPCGGYVYGGKVPPEESVYSRILPQ